MTDAPAARAASEEPPGLLERPPEEASRLLALRFLDAAREARARLGDPADGEALHDFRVALRRLRSTLRSFAEPLGDTVPRKLARRLKKLAGSTNALRDCEVQLQWLAAAPGAGAPGLSWTAAERRAARWLGARLQELEAVERAACLEEIERRHGALDRALRRRLLSLRIELDLSARGGRRQLRLGGWLAVRVLDLGAELAGALAEVETVADGAAAHRARIAAKRLRYLLEPLRDDLPAAAPVAELKALQDDLGALHDAQVLIATLADLVAGAAAARARLRITLAGDLGSDDPAVKAAGRSAAPAGTLLLVDRLRAEQHEHFAAVERGWLAGRAAPFFAGIEALAGNLRAGDSGA